MKLLWGAKASDFLYILIHTLVWIAVYFLTLALVQGNGAELAYALIAGWFSALYLTVFYTVRWHAWYIALFVYAAFGLTIEYQGTYLLFHLDFLDQYGNYAVIAAHSFIFAGPILFNKIMMAGLAGKRT